MFEAADLSQRLASSFRSRGFNRNPREFFLQLS